MSAGLTYGSPDAKAHFNLIEIGQFVRFAPLSVRTPPESGPLAARPVQSTQAAPSRR
jgi:hypothetical protein